VPPRQTPDGKELSPGIEAIILRALSKHRDGRFDSMEEFGGDLDRLARGEMPIALTYADAETSVFNDPEAPPMPMRIAPHAMPSAVAPATVPEGRLSARDVETSAMAAVPRGVIIESSRPSMVPVATGRSIPPVTAAGAVGRRAGTPLIVLSLGAIGLVAFATAAVMALRHNVDGSNAHRALGAHEVTVVQQPTGPLAPGPSPVTVVVPSAAPTADVPTAPDPQPSNDATTPTIRLQSDPEGALVTQGRHRIGTTPIEVARPLLTGSQSYTLTAPGHLAAHVTLRADSASEIEVMLLDRGGDASGAHSGSGHGDAPGSGGHGGGSGHSEILDPWAAGGR
jgi:hypothetical protein